MPSCRIVAVSSHLYWTCMMFYLPLRQELLCAFNCELLCFLSTFLNLTSIWKLTHLVALECSDIWCVSTSYMRLLEHTIFVVKFWQMKWHKLLMFSPICSGSKRFTEHDGIIETYLKILLHWLYCSIEELAGFKISEMNVAHPLRASKTEWSSWTSIRLSVHSWRLLVENWIDAWKRLFSDKVPLLLHFLKFYLLTSKVSLHLVLKEGHEDSVTSSLTSTQMLMSRPLLHDKERKKCLLYSCCSFRYTRYTVGYM